MGGDRGAGDREKRGREVYGRREKREREAGFPRWREAGEKGGNYATLRNISQSKKSKGVGAKKYRAGTGITGYGKREVQTPLSPPPYIGETKRHLHERFGEHRRSVQNHQQLANPTPVSEHFNLPGHSVNDIRLIPLELIHTNRDSVRKAREAHLIDKAKTLEPQGLNRRDELH